MAFARKDDTAKTSASQSIFRIASRLFSTLGLPHNSKEWAHRLISDQPDTRLCGWAKGVVMNNTMASNLAFDTTEKSIRGLFLQFGIIERITITTDQATCVVPLEVPDDEAAELAIAAMRRCRP
jgi:hypothetical protein